jgi:hypothetical protein
MSRLLPHNIRPPYPVSLVDNGKPSPTTRYLDISSAYRDRSLYPQTCNFIVQVNNNNSTSNPIGSNDPIVLGFPYDAGLLSGGSTNTQFALSVNSSNILNFYRGSFICIGTYYGKIIAYDNTTQVATVDAPGIPGPPPPALTPYTIRYELPLPLDNVPTYQEATTVNTPINIFQPGPLGQQQDLQNRFVLFQGANFPDTAQWGYLDYIQGTVFPNVQYRVRNPNPNYVFGPILAGSTYELYTFSYDNVRPLKYQGTDLIQTPSCELRLTSLLLPSLPLKNGYGGRLYDYSHLYVSVSSAKGSTYSNPMISNAPASSTALFQVPITFLYFPFKSFYSLIFTGMNQRILFRESDDLLIKIMLPNGEVLQFEQPESLLFFPGYGFPIPTNPFTQIQMLVEVTRIP